MRIVILVCLLVGCASALPANISEREVVAPETRNPIIEAIIRGLLEGLRFIIDDPLRENELSLDLDELLEINGLLHLRELVVTGLSEFEVIELNVSGIFTQQMECKLGLTHLHAQADEYDLRVAVDGITVNGNGPAVIELTDVAVHVRANVFLIGIIGGNIQLSECHLKLSIGKWQSKIENIVGGKPESDFINAVLAYLIPELVEFYEDEISEALCELVMDQVNNS